MRSGEVDRGEADEDATEGRRDSTFLAFEDRPESLADDFFAADLDAFEAGLETVFRAGLTTLTFRLLGLPRDLAGFAVFFAGLGFAFALVAIGPATYTGYAS